MWASSSVAPALSNLDFVLGSTNESVTWPLILGMLWFSIGQVESYFMKLWSQMCSCSFYALITRVLSVNNSEEKSYASSIFIGRRCIGDINSSNGAINSHALRVMARVNFLFM
jgi:hypothetical protein